MRAQRASREAPPPVYRITATTLGHAEDLANRQTRYLLSMGVRTLCFLSAVAVWFGLGLAWLSALLFVGAILLPYVSVVVANAGRERAEQLPLTVLTPRRPALERGSGPSPHAARPDTDHRGAA